MYMSNVQTFRISSINHALGTAVRQDNILNMCFHSYIPHNKTPTHTMAVEYVNKIIYKCE